MLARRVELTAVNVARLGRLLADLLGQVVGEVAIHQVRQADRSTVRDADDPNLDVVGDRADPPLLDHCPRAGQAERGFDVVADLGRDAGLSEILELGGAVVDLYVRRQGVRHGREEGQVV